MKSSPENSNNKLLHFWVGLFGGGTVLLVTIVGFSMLQFLLQFTLAGYQDTPEFWTLGLLLGLFWGSCIGVPLGIVAG